LAIYYDADWFWEINRAYKSREIVMRNWLEQVSALLPANQQVLRIVCYRRYFARDLLADLFGKKVLPTNPGKIFMILLS